MEKSDYPVQLVQVTEKNHRKIDTSRNQDKKIFGDGATPQKRRLLAEQTSRVIEYFSSDFANTVGIAGIAKVTLVDEALAKSHRPTNLFSALTCPIVGTLDFGELLVSASKDGLVKLQQRILTNQSKSQIANISSVQSIEPYTNKDRFNSEHFTELKRNVSSGTGLKLKLFNHFDQNKNSVLKQSLSRLASSHNIRLRELNYGGATGLILAESDSVNAVETLSGFIGLRYLSTMPVFQPVQTELQMTTVGAADDSLFPSPNIDEDYPIVGVIDSGVCPNSHLIKPWIYASESYVPRGLEDHFHGTMVAGLVINPKSINHSDERFPSGQARIVDVNIFPKNGAVKEEDLVAIIEEVVEKYQFVKVWNLSLGSKPAHSADFSDFAHFLDEIQDRFSCLFVVSSGNQNDPGLWPTSSGVYAQNRILSPADSTRALTVGSLAHKCHATSIVNTEELSPFSRIGPGPCFIPKPEVVHYGGNATASGISAQLGVLSLGPNDCLVESIGTSFAAPMVSNIAGCLYHYLSNGGEEYVPAERLKALITHSALLNSDGVNKETINYTGFGKPGDTIEQLYCDPNCITMIFDTDVRHGGFEFERFPFPIPDCLNADSGKFKGEITMTLVYSPLTNKEFASEYCRTNVDVGMGSFERNKEGKVEFHSKVPQTPGDLKDMYEKAQIESGFKWSPVKAYRRATSRGISVETWRLLMKVSRRAEENIPETDQPATLVLSLRGLDPEQPVYNETIQKMRSLGWVTTDIDQNIRVRMR